MADAQLAALPSRPQRVKALETELGLVSSNVNAQLASKDELILQLQRQVEEWKAKYQALAKLYSQLRTEHLDLLNKSKGMQLKANSAQEAVDRMERMEKDVKAKNLELAEMIRERDRSRFDVDRVKAVRPCLPFRSRSCAPELTPPPRLRPRRATRMRWSASSATCALPTSAPTTPRATSRPTRRRSSRSTTGSSPSSRTRSGPSRCRSTSS